MIYKNARIITNNKTINGYIELDDKGNIITIKKGNTSRTGIDCKNKIIMPGFIDPHTHGGYGMSFDDFNVNDDFFNCYENYLKNIATEGVVGFVSTNVSLHLKKLNQINIEVNKYLNKFHKSFKKFPQMVGWFFEGPFINTIKKGAHDEKVIVPINESFLKDAIKKINIPIICAVAPEINGNLDLVKKYKNDIIFALGHSNANYKESVDAFKNGCTRVIHLYNAMSGFSHRDMGIVNAVFNKEYKSNCSIELIADGVHVSNEVMKTSLNIIGSDNLAIVSDCLAAKGLEDNIYMLGTLEIDKRGNWFYLKGSNTLAGGGCPFNYLVKKFKDATKCSWEEIVKLTSFNTARNLKLAKNYGDLIINKPANLIMIDDKCNIHLTISNGSISYEKI